MQFHGRTATCRQLTTHHVQAAPHAAVAAMPRLHLPAPDALVRIERPPGSPLDTRVVPAAASSAAAAADQRAAAAGRLATAQAGPQPRRTLTAQTQPGMSNTAPSAKPSGLPMRPATQHQPPAVTPAAVTVTKQNQAGTPGLPSARSAVFQPTPAAAAAVKSEPVSSTASPASGRGRLGASPLEPSARAAAGQGTADRDIGAPKGTPARALAAVPVPPTAGTFLGSQQHVGARPSLAAQSDPALLPIMPAAAQSVTAIGKGAPKPADTVSLAAAHLARKPATAASKPETAHGAATATGPAAAHKWQPPPHMSARLDPDSQAGPVSEAAVHASKASATGSTALSVPEPGAANGEPGTSRPVKPSARKRQLPAKLAAMTAAAAAPTINSAEGKAASGAAVSASAENSGAAAQSAAKPVVGTPAPAQQRPQSAGQQQPLSASAKVRLQPPAKSLPAARAALSVETPAAGTAKARSTSLKVRSDSALGLKRLDRPPSRAASTELHILKRPSSGSPSGPDTAPAKPPAPARGPAGSAPRPQQPSSIAGLLNPQQPDSRSPWTALVPASPEWGGKAAAVMKPSERKTQIGGAPARPTLLANLQSLVKAAGTSCLWRLSALLQLCEHSK